MVDLAKACKVLIADDDEDLVTTLRAFLESKGFQTAAVHEGVRVIETAKRWRPDLLILDLKMPAGQGQTVLNRLKHQDETRHLPVLILSGVTDPQTKDEILAAGAAGFVLKPYDHINLVQTIRDVLRQPGANSWVAESLSV